MYTMGTAGVDYPGGLPGYTTGKPLATNPRVNLYSLAANGGNTVDLVVTAADGVTRETYTIHIEQHGPGVYGEVGGGASLTPSLKATCFQNLTLKKDKTFAFQFENPFA